MARHFSFVCDCILYWTFEMKTKSMMEAQNSNRIQYILSITRVHDIYCINVLAYARVCGTACLIYRSGEINQMHDTDTNVYMFVFWLQIRLLKKSCYYFWCSLLTYVVSMIIVTSIWYHLYEGTLIFLNEEEGKKNSAESFVDSSVLCPVLFCNWQPVSWSFYLDVKSSVDLSKKSVSVESVNWDLFGSALAWMSIYSQEHHTIDRLEERDVGRGSARRSSLTGREGAIVNQTNIGTVSKATLGKLLRDGWNAYGLFRAHTYHLELNWIGCV